MRLHLPIGVIAVVALALLTASPVAGGGDGTVTFRLTLRGTPAPTDSFSLAVTADNGRIISPGVRCGPGSDLYNDSHVSCTAHDYDFVVTIPVGTRLTYTYARYVNFLASGGAQGAQRLLEGSITVGEAPQSVTLVHDYSFGSVAGSSTTLPNTSLELPTGSGSGVVALAILGGLGVRIWRRTRRAT
jgi:hypothetical protein